MPIGRLVRWLLPVLVLLGPTRGLVDESGRYRQGGDLSSLAPPEPTEEDRSAAVDLSKQPPEKLFRLLAYELLREEKRPPERRLGIREFQLLTERSCPERLLELAKVAGEVSEDVRIYHLNVTGTAGLYWLLHQYPDEHSWVWVISISHERVLRKVGQHFSRLAVYALDDPEGCLSPSFRTILMNAAAMWRKMYGDHTALLWNGIAFGLLGDVTSWREVDEEGQTADAPGGEPPNVSWSENLIFGNMWVSSAQKWLEFHAQELSQATHMELARSQAGMPPESHSQRWRRSESGALTSFEYLRRQLFAGWPLDKGLLRGFLRHCLRPGYGSSERPSVGDFGAGGGRYSEWLNETGLVQAFAFDAARAVGDITGGAVQEANLATDVRLWRTFDWVLCLELGPYVPAAQAQTLLRNVRRHAGRGLLMSWSSDPEEGAQAHPLSEPEFVALAERETGFLLDRAATEAIRRGCELGLLSRTVAVFRAPV